MPDYFFRKLQNANHVVQKPRKVNIQQHLPEPVHVPAPAPAPAPEPVHVPAPASAPLPSTTVHSSAIVKNSVTLHGGPSNIKRYNII